MKCFSRDQIFKEYSKLLKIASGELYPRIIKVRDLSIIPLLGQLSLIIACDSNASIGEKPNDFYQNSYEEMGISALKVPMMEVIATGATPLVVVNNLCVEMEPSGRKIIEAMTKELKNCGLMGKIQFTGSTEDNMLTTQTGAGVTVIGIGMQSKLKLGKTREGDIVVCVGIPKSGINTPYSERDEDIAKITTVFALVQLDYVHEILPVGSKGVFYEANELARICRRKFSLTKDKLTIDIMSSAGSSTAVIVSIENNDLNKLKEDINIPIFEIGRIK